MAFLELNHLIGLTSLDHLHPCGTDWFICKVQSSGCPWTTILVVSSHSNPPQLEGPWILSPRWRNIFSILFSIMHWWNMCSLKDPVGFLRDNALNMQDQIISRKTNVPYIHPWHAACLNQSLARLVWFSLPFSRLPLKISYTPSSNLKLSFQFVRVCVLSYRLWRVWYYGNRPWGPYYNSLPVQE